MNATLTTDKLYRDVELPTRNQLGQLSRRAIIAFAARCVRRSQSCYQSHHPGCPAAIEQAIAAAEKFARGERFSVSGAQIKFAVKHALNRGSRYIAQAALFLAQATVISDQVENETDASNAVYKAWLAIAAAYNAAPELSWLFAARDDFDFLSVKHRGNARVLGQAVNAAGDGPLGGLWGESTTVVCELPTASALPLTCSGG